MVFVGRVGRLGRHDRRRPPCPSRPEGTTTRPPVRPRCPIFAATSSASRVSLFPSLHPEPVSSDRRPCTRRTRKSSACCRSSNRPSSASRLPTADTSPMGRSSEAAFVKVTPPRPWRPAHYDRGALTTATRPTTTTTQRRRTARRAPRQQRGQAVRGSSSRGGSGRNYPRYERSYVYR